jgi:hypothetical protein
MLLYSPDDRFTAKPVDRKGNPLAIKLTGKVEPYLEKA